MYQNRKYISGVVIKLMLVSLLTFAVFGCDMLTPAKYKSQTYSAPAIDALAGQLMTKDTINDAQGYTIAYQYNPIYDTTGAGIPDTVGKVIPTTWSTVNSKVLQNIVGSVSESDNQIISTHFNMLADSLANLNMDSLLLVKYADTAKATYAVLKATKAEDIYIYTCLDYYYKASNNTSNLSDYVSVDLIKQDTSLVGSSSAVSPEGSYSSIEKILVSGTTKIVSVTGAKYTFHLDKSGTYIIRFTLSSPTEISNPQFQPHPANYNLPSIQDQFKVVILSSSSSM